MCYAAIAAIGEERDCNLYLAEGRHPTRELAPKSSNTTISYYCTSFLITLLAHALLWDLMSICGEVFGRHTTSEQRMDGEHKCRNGWAALRVQHPRHADKSCKGRHHVHLCSVCVRFLDYFCADGTLISSRSPFLILQARSPQQGRHPSMYTYIKLGANLRRACLCRSYRTSHGNETGT